MGKRVRRKTGPLFHFRPGRSSQGDHHMTISANGRAPSDDTLERSLELYRDLSVALSEKIATFKSIGGDPVGKEGPVEAVKEHRKALQTVLDIEASLGKRSRAWIEGTSLELDLLAARAEIVARLAVWLT